MAQERELLSNCGLNETEQTVLLYLLEYGRSAASIIAKRTGLKRPTVYSALGNLSSLGLVSKHAERSTALYSAIDPETIPTIFINRAKGQFEKVTQAALRLESHLKEFKLGARKRFGGYEISTIDSTDATFAFIETVLIKGNYRGIFNPQSAFAKLRGKEAGERCLNITARSRPWIREIAIAGPVCDWWVARIRNPNHLVKQVPLTPTIVTDMLLSDGSVILTNYEQSREMCILIRHADYYQFMVEMFDSFWNSLPEA